MAEKSSWLADGVREIERVTKAAAIVEPKILTLSLEKAGTYAIVTPGPSGSDIKMEVKVAGPKWHSERLETSDELVNFITSLKDRDRKPEDGAVYVGRDSIRYVYSFEDRRDRVTVPLILSEPWKWLMKPPGPIDQRMAIRVLRIIFAGCLSSGSPLIDVLRRVTFSNNNTVEANLQKGRESLGRSILNEAAGIANFPDEFLLSVPVFENFQHTVLIRVALEVLPDLQKFELIPFPNQLQSGLENTLQRLRDHIAEGATVPAFIGNATYSARENDE